ncbi:replication initiation protein [Bacillus piscicola]|uniref:replication initiation protein n=1 Tax=Bacillus piscicola TaxID=1632684 RepID=UPI001F094AD7|nr:replication initiation protein [Bacillus piscicola]
MVALKTIENDTIVKSNKLNEALFNLSSIEYKLVLYIASKIKKADKDFKTYKIPVREFTQAIGVKGNAYHKEIENISEEIMSKPIKFVDEEGFQISNWFSYIRYRRNDGYIEVRFDANLKPYLLNLEGNFLQYTFRQISSLKSTHSIRMFELIKQYLVIGHRIIDLEDLRKMLDVEDKYKRYSNFKQRILLRAIDEIKGKTDLRFEVEEIKKGRSVQKIKFYDIKFMEAEFNSYEEAFVTDTPLEEKVKNAFFALGVYIREDDLKEITSYPEMVVQNAMEQLNNKMRSGSVNYPVSYLKGILQNLHDAPEAMESSVYDRLCKAICDTYKGEKGTVPGWLIEETAKSVLKIDLKIEDEEQMNSIWSQFGKSIIQQVNKMIEKNRRLGKK